MEVFYVSILAAISVVLTSVILYYKWAFQYWSRKGVVSAPASIPFGSMTKVMRKQAQFGELFKEIYQQYKPQKLPYVGCYLVASPILVLLDLKIIKDILTKDFEHFTDHGNYVNEEHEPLTGTLFALKGQKWRNLRVKLTPTFTSGKMKMMFDTLVACSRGLEEVMDDIRKKGKPVEIKDVVARYTTDVIGSCAFGLDCNSLKDPNSEFRRYGKKIFDGNIHQLFVRILALVSPQIVNFLGLKFFSSDLTNFMNKIVKDTVEYREKSNIKRNDFMQLLIQLRNNATTTNGKSSSRNKEHSSQTESFTIEQMTAQAFVFFVAGFETSSTLLTFCLYELVTNKDIQEKLRVEVKTVLQKYKNNITYDALLEMTYMDKCLQETLRKYPPIPVLFRDCTKRYTFPESNFTIEKGTRVFISAMGIHWDPSYYPDPEKFDPERFSPENKANRDHFTWLPFGEGPRMCLGLRFGLMQTKVALTALLRDNKFDLNQKTKTPLVMSSANFILEVKGGVWLDVKKIE